jgi:hypothetical protein
MRYATLIFIATTSLAVALPKDFPTELVDSALDKRDAAIRPIPVEMPEPNRVKRDPGSAVPPPATKVKRETLPEKTDGGSTGGKIKRDANALPEPEYVDSPTRVKREAEPEPQSTGNYYPRGKRGLNPRAPSAGELEPMHSAKRLVKERRQAVCPSWQLETWSTGDCTEDQYDEQSAPLYSYDAPQDCKAFDPNNSPSSFKFDGMGVWLVKLYEDVDCQCGTRQGHECHYVDENDLRCWDARGFRAFTVEKAPNGRC